MWCFLERCATAEVLLAMAHDISDELISRMPRLRYICALSAGTDRLETLTTLRSGVHVTFQSRNSWAADI